MKALRFLLCLFLCARLVAAPAQQAAASVAANELNNWITVVRAAGGTFTSTSIPIAANLWSQILSRSYNTKIVFVMAFLGNDLTACMVPLVNRLGATVTHTFAGSVTQAAGAQGNGSSYIIRLNKKPSDLGTSDNGGLGYWETNINFTGTDPAYMGGAAYSDTTKYYAVWSLAGFNGGFYWGLGANGALQAGTGANGFYYGQRSSSIVREIYKDGSLLNTNTTSDTNAASSATNLSFIGIIDNSEKYWAGRSAVCIGTTGDLTSGEVSDLYSDLQTYLMTPTGR